MSWAPTLPQSPFGWAAAALGIALWIWAWRQRTCSKRQRHYRAYVWGLSALAAFASAAYVHQYLRGGPRIIDATAYLLQARTFASGSLSFDVPGPLYAFTGRFLLTTPSDHLSVIFPPGYAAVLAPAAALGVPMALGPLLAAALVHATFRLGKQLFNADVGLCAAAISAVCMCLRYHTADTMSHGLSALLAIVALSAALSARHDRPVSYGAVTGLCMGWLIATRPVTGLFIGTVILGLMLRNPRALAACAVAAIPGLALLGGHQYVTTGSWLRSTQLEYYARADGPVGCFSYGFGPDIGCRFEHGDFIQKYMPNGYGWREAVGTTARRIGPHLTDLANCAPLALLAFGFAAKELSTRRDVAPITLLLLMVGAQVVAYVPFYFDGNYPGGGARLLADALPFEHVLLALALVRLGRARMGVGLALLWFGVSSEAGHRELRDREGGRPMFEPSRATAAGGTRNLVLVRTDHGFNLGHDPRSPGPLVARDGTREENRWLVQALGDPPAYRYLFDFSGRRQPQLLNLPIEAAQPRRRIQAEHLWPVRAVRAGYVHPVYVPCAGAGAALGGADGFDITLDIKSNSDVITVGWAALGDGHGSLNGSRLDLRAGSCGSTTLSAAKRRRVELRAEGPVAVDYIEPKTQ